MAKIRFILNDQEIEEEGTQSRSVLDYLRQTQRLVATKEGCREGGCGACTVLLGQWEGDRVLYRSVLACLLPLADLAGCHLVTLEGLNQDRLSPVQQAVVEAGAIQCGYCTPGMVMALTGYLLSSDRHDPSEALSGNLCRCTGYTALRRASQTLFLRVRDDHRPLTLQRAVERHLLPPYFLSIPQRLAPLQRQPHAIASTKPMFVAGGSDWMLETRAKTDAKDEAVEFLNQTDLPRGITVQNNELRIGALTTFAELAEHPLSCNLIPQLPQYIQRIASYPVRQRATVGGNLVTASPIGDLSVLLLALGAQLRLRQGAQTRVLSIDDFFSGYRTTALQPGEVLAEICLPLDLEAQQINFEKVSKRNHLDCAAVNSAIWVQREQALIQQIRIAMGGVAASPILLRQTAQVFQGQSLTPEVVQKALLVVQGEINPISDIYGSADYKRLLARQLILAHFSVLFPTLSFEGGGNAAA